MFIVQESAPEKEIINIVDGNNTTEYKSVESVAQLVRALVMLMCWNWQITQTKNLAP